MTRWCLLLLFGLGLAPGHAQAATVGPARTVRYGLVPVEPLVFRKDGRPAGLCVDLLEAVAADQGWTVEYVDGSWDENLGRLVRGEIDLLAPTGWSAARDSLLDFAQRPILTLWSQVYVRAGSPVETIVDLAGRRVAVMRGDINGDHFRHYVARFGIACTIVELSTFAEVLDQVRDQQVDAGVVANVYGYVNAPDRRLVASPIIFEPFRVYYTTAAGADADLLAALDAALAEGQDAGTSFYHDRLDHWFGGRESGPGAIPSWLLAAAAAVLLLAMALLVGNRSLEREVRRRTRELRRSEEQFRAIFDHNIQLTGLLAPDGTLIGANPAALAIVGARMEDVVGRPFLDGPWWGHDAGQRERLRAGLDAAKGGKLVRFEVTHPAPDGSLRLVDFSLKPIHDDQGQLMYLLPEGRDITDQRHGEIRYRSLFEAAGDAIFVMENGIFIECNARTLEMFGCKRAEIIGCGPDRFSPKVQPDGSPSGAAAAARMATAARDGLHAFEWRHCRLDGQEFDAEVTLTAYTAAGHEYLQAIVRDVTGRKRLEADLRHAQKMEAIGTLAGGIAHDFNNILAAIFGFCELARFDAGQDPQQTAHLDQILRAAERARDLVRQILAFSRRTAVNRRPVDVADIVDETMGLLRSSIPATIALRWEASTRGPVEADPTSLHQVVMNLCTNAYQALAGRGEVAVSLREVQVAPGEPGAAPGTWVVLEVRDDGPGMSAAVRAKIFEPYFTTKSADQGTGLGLAVVLGIVEEQGGRIEVETAPGEGALFRIWLPRRAAGVETGPAAAGIAAGEATGNERVLLVDDEDDIVRICEMGLSRSGFLVQGHTSAAGALAAFRRDPGAWDVLITDLTMPGMTGLDLARSVLAERPDLPVILCTGYSDGPTAGAARAAGVRDVVLKPVPPSVLVERIRAVVDVRVPC
ncbi:MAG TPA: PAS domain S-box protein [Candidatus Krumholzibacteria bacterium]|nr:PAS domain S-box protein [Candidatus Krumholzibacteria bacterium]